MNNPRAYYFLLSLSTLVLGLCSRRYSSLLPGWLAAYTGDTLWALLMFWLLGLGWPSAGCKWRALGALGFAYLIELSQLFHPLWLDALRATTLGGLVLGHGFLWSDLVCYTVGVVSGVMLEKLGQHLLGHFSSKTPNPL